MKKVPADNSENCFKNLITAIIKQAIKDGAVWFFKTERGKGYCAAVGINPVKLMGGIV
ncbi:hypothetical protein R84B8_00606 [Treponema sp. R8-4-B8]